MNKVTHGHPQGHSQNCKPRRPFVSEYDDPRYPVFLVRTQVDCLGRENGDCWKTSFGQEQTSRLLLHSGYSFSAIAPKRT